jgi:hypothetical protein
MPTLYPVLPPAEQVPILYRVVDHDPPVRDDFLSDEERGVPAAAHETRWHRQGLSVFDKIGLARGLAKWRLREGFVSRTFIAAVLLQLVPVRMTEAPSQTADSYVIVRPESPGNVWGFWTEAEALDAVRESIALDGPTSVHGWHLVRVPVGEDEESEWETIAEGEALAALAASKQERSTN